MPITLRCPQGHSLVVVEKYAGRRAKCPKCQAVIKVPGVSNAAKESVSRLPEPGAATNGGIRTPPPLPTPTAAPPVVFGTLDAPTQFADASFVETAPQPVDNRTGVQVYLAEKSEVVTVYWVGLGLLVLVLFQLAPVATHLNLVTAPVWVHWVLALAVIQLAYVAWMVSLPDFTTVRVTTFVSAGIATLYGVALGMAVVTPQTRPLLLDMEDVRTQSRIWCSAVLLLTCLMTYLCGRVAFRWQQTGNH